MKKWYICKYGQHHIQAPHECTPIGVAYQITHEDEDQDVPGTFLLEDKFISWLQRKDLCAFGEGYADALRIVKSTVFPTLYP